MKKIKTTHNNSILIYVKTILQLINYQNHEKNKKEIQL
jgi:hypothetical protein